MLDAKHWTFLTLAVVFFVIATIIGGSYLGAREDKIKLQATMDAQKQVIAAADDRQKERDAQMDTFLKAQQAQTEALNKRFDQIKTPQDLAPVVQQLMSLQKPITFVTPPATAANPNPQPVAQVPVEDAPQIKAYVQACESCKLNLQTTTQKLTFAEQQHADDLVKIGSLTKERDTAVETAKGGNWLKRATRTVKMAVCGAGGAAAGGVGAGTKGATIGALVGVVACSIN